MRSPLFSPQNGGDVPAVRVQPAQRTDEAIPVPPSTVAEASYRATGDSKFCSNLLCSADSAVRADALQLLSVAGANTTGSALIGTPAELVKREKSKEQVARSLRVGVSDQITSVPRITIGESCRGFRTVGTGAIIADVAAQSYSGSAVGARRSGHEGGFRKAVRWTMPSAHETVKSPCAKL